jgi:hypothetical protein
MWGGKRHVLGGGGECSQRLGGERDHLENVDEDGRMILKHICNKINVPKWTPIRNKIQWRNFRPLPHPLRCAPRGALLVLFCMYDTHLTINIQGHYINRLTPNDPYMCRTAPLTFKRCILYIYSTNIGTEYFKHALYSPFLFLFKMQFVS